jgi:hypothetical protein
LFNLANGRYLSFPEPLAGAATPLDPSNAKKTGKLVQFEITEQTRASIRDWVSARIVHAWVESAGLDSSAYGAHSMRRTKSIENR